LLSVESRLAKILDDDVRAYELLERAFNANPRNGYIAVRLARHMRSLGQKEKANVVLERCLGDNPTSREVHLDIALSLILEDERSHKDDIERHLRSSFTDGDTNYDAQFWAARHSLLFGDRRRALSLFDGLKRA